MELDGEKVELTRKEFDLLAELMAQPGQVVTREDLMSRVWDVNWFGSTKTLDVHIRTLSQKLGDDSSDPALHRDGARRRLSTDRPGAGFISLRTRLTIAVAYLLLLALIAFGVPLAVSLGDRVDSEVKAQAENQANLVAASAPELLEHGQLRTLQRLVDSSAQSQRGRVLVVDSAGRVIADSAGRGELGAELRLAPGDRRGPGGRTVQETRDSQHPGHADPGDRGARSATGPGSRARCRVTQSVDAVHRATRRAIVSLILLGGVVLGLGVLAGALIARSNLPARSSASREPPGGSRRVI